MSHLRTALLQMLYDGWQARAPYTELLRSIIVMEYSSSTSYEFFDGELKRRGIVYKIGLNEVFWLKPTDTHPEQLLIPSQRLREDLLDLLAVHPLYAKWFG